MATVNNRIGGTAVQKKTKSDQIVKFMANGVEVKLSPAIVKKFLISGNPENVTEQEVMMFLMLCSHQQLDPFLKEAYCIKYGSSPATIVVGKEAFMKRAEDHPQFDGFEAGIIVVNDGGLEYRNGSFVMDGDSVVGGWAEVFRKDRGHSIRAEVSFDEYAGKTKDGKLNSQWASKRATMIRKVALVQALREAFPKSLGGMYTAEEKGEQEPEESTIDRSVVEEAQMTEVNEVPAAAPDSSAADALFGEQEEF